MGAYLDITIDGGATFNTTVALTDVNSNPLNLSNTAFNGTAKTSFFTANIAANIIVSIANSNTGTIFLGLDALTTANLCFWPSQYYYDIVMTNTQTNFSQRVLQGILYVNPAVSITPFAT